MPSCLKVYPRHGLDKKDLGVRSDVAGSDLWNDHCGGHLAAVLTEALRNPATVQERGHELPSQ